MAKRIYEVAKELGKPVNELLDILKKHKIDKTNFSSASERDIQLLKNAYTTKVVRRVTAVRIGGVDVDRKDGQLRGPVVTAQAQPVARSERRVTAVRIGGVDVDRKDGQLRGPAVTTQAQPKPQPKTAAPSPQAQAGDKAQAKEQAPAAAKTQATAAPQPKPQQSAAPQPKPQAAAAPQLKPQQPPAPQAKPQAQVSAQPKPQTAAAAHPQAPAAAAPQGKTQQADAPQPRSQATVAPQPKPQTAAAPQVRSQQPAAPQPKPQATTAPQAKPQQAAAPQARAQAQPAAPAQPKTQSAPAQPRAAVAAPQTRSQYGGAGQPRPQGQRPQGSSNPQAPRPQGAQGYGQRPGGSRPAYGQGGRPQGQGGAYGQGPRPQGAGQRRDGQGPRPGGFAPRPQGAPGQGRSGGQGARPAGGARPGAGALPKAENRPRRPDAARGGRDERREGGKNAGKSRKNISPVKGSYATKESRPNRSAGHQMPVNRAPKKGPVRPIAAETVVRPASVEVGETISVQNFAKLIKREVNEVIKTLFLLGQMVTINQDIDFETAQLIGTEFEVEVLPAPREEDPTEIPPVEDPEELRTPRPPVITVMGHVDHGKTSILDAIRKTNVTAREAGGITQHIGAYKVNYQGKQIVFLDTPGHEAFTAMRARGAQVTDIAILVVAADDGVMPQTIEAINHAKAAKVPIIVAINKMDRAGANPDHVKQQLAEHELIPEDWGGDTIMVPCSAYTKEGITDLLDMILLVAEVQELKANADLPAHGTIIEAQLDKGRGPVATVLIQRGTLRVGDTIIAGTCYGKVRAMINDRGEKVKKATPATPVEVLGLSDVPEAGDILDCTEERIARSVAAKRLAQKREKEIKAPSKVSLDDIYQRIKDGELKELNIVVKADVQGTIEALKASLQKIKNEEVKVVVVHAGVGAITESDVMLASAANALIIGFNVRPDANARKAAETSKVDLRTYRVIYDALNDVEAAIKGMLAPKFTEVVQGRVEVRQLITIMKLLVAGCYVLEGKVTNNSKVRIIRDGIVLPVEDQVESLRRFKDDVKEVQQGFECGITLSKFRDLKEGDIFEVYAMEEVAAE